MLAAAQNDVEMKNEAIKRTFGKWNSFFGNQLEQLNKMTSQKINDLYEKATSQGTVRNHIFEY